MSRGKVAGGGGVNEFIRSRGEPLQLEIVKPHETGLYYSYQVRMHTASQVVLMLDKLQEKIKALVCAGDFTNLVCPFLLLTAVRCISAYIILRKYTFQIPSVQSCQAKRLAGL